jgi:hypothetical protein
MDFGTGSTGSGANQVLGSSEHKYEPWNWIYLAQEQIKFWAFINTVMDFETKFIWHRSN